MRILHVLDHSLPIYDGYSFRSRSILGAQRKAGHEPVVVTSPKHEAYAAGECAAREEIDGVGHYRAGRVPGSPFPFLGELRLMAATKRRLEQVVANGRPLDLIHAHSPVLNALPALRVARRLRVPLVYEVRSFWEDAAADQGTYAEGSPKYRLVRGLETFCCRRADAVVPICRGLRDDLVGRGVPAGKVHVVPNAVEPDEFPEAAADEDFRRRWGLAGKVVVGFLGSFYHFEGLDVLVEALAELAPEYPNLVGLLVGGGEMDGRLRALAQERGVADRVLFPGRVPHEDVPGIYGLVDVLAYPRKPMRLTELVTPLKPLEAMAMGRALVASDVGGHRELVRDGETGLLHRAGDPRDLARSLRRLFSEPGLRTRLEANGKAWVRENRTWARNAEAYETLYRSLAEKGGPL